MDIIITIQHPAHVHFFKNAIWDLQERGHSVHVYTRKREMATMLLEKLNISYEVLAGSVGSIIDLPVVQSQYEFNLFRKARNIQPDVLMAIGEPAITHVSTLLNSKSILFIDTEHSKLQKYISVPFADRIYSPESFSDDLGEHHAQYPGYHELAYLHPNRFEPDPTILDEMGIAPDDQFVILRTVDWNAAHDIGDSGFESITDAVSSIKQAGAEVFITTEGEIPETIDEHQITVEPHRVHHLMYYADLFIGESGTMACESAILGTPSIFVNTLSLGYLDELEDRYGLVFNYSQEDRHRKALQKAESILKQESPKRWEKKRDSLLSDKIDTTKFILNQIEEITPE